MRPYLFGNYGGTWLDLDHILAIEPSEQYLAVKLEMAFRNEPVWINYHEPSDLPNLIETWKAK